MTEQPDRRDATAGAESPDRRSDATDGRPDPSGSDTDEAASGRRRSGERDADGADSAAHDGAAEDEPSLAGVFGARSEEAPPRPEIRPESPSLENAAFVVLGVLLALFTLYRLLTIMPA